MSDSLGQYYRTWEKFDVDEALTEEEEDSFGQLGTTFLGGIGDDKEAHKLYRKPEEHHGHGHGHHGEEGDKKPRKSIAEKQKELPPMDRSQLRELLDQWTDQIEIWESKFEYNRLRLRDALVAQDIGEGENQILTALERGLAHKTFAKLDISPQVYEQTYDDLVRKKSEEGGLTEAPNNAMAEVEKVRAEVNHLEEMIKCAKHVRSHFEMLVKDNRELELKERQPEKIKANLQHEKQYCNELVSRIEGVMHDYPWLREGIFTAESSPSTTSNAEEAVRSAFPEKLACFFCRIIVRVCVFYSHILWSLGLYGQSFDMLRVVLCVDQKNAKAWTYRGKVASAFGQFVLADLQINQAIQWKNMREAAIPLDTPFLNAKRTTISVLPTAFEICPSSCPREVLTIMNGSNRLGESTDEHKVLELLRTGLHNFGDKSGNALADGCPKSEHLDSIEKALEFCRSSSDKISLVNLKQKNFSVIDSSSDWGAASWHIFHFLRCFGVFKGILSLTELPQFCSRFILNEFREMNVLSEEVLGAVGMHPYSDTDVQHCQKTAYTSQIEDAILQVRILYHEGLNFSCHSLGEMYARALLTMFLVTGGKSIQFLFDASEFLVISAMAASYRYNCQEYGEQVVDSAINLLSSIRDEMEDSMEQVNQRRLYLLLSMATLLKVQLEIKMVRPQNAGSCFHQAKEYISQYAKFSMEHTCSQFGMPRLHNILPDVERHELEGLKKTTQRDLFHFTRRWKTLGVLQ